MNDRTKWITTMPEKRVEEPEMLIPVNQIGRLQAIMLFRAASGLGLYDAKQVIDINFPLHQRPQGERSTLSMVEFRDFLIAWREAHLRGFA